MRVLAFDPAGESFGVAGLQVQESGKLDLYLNFLLKAPEDWDVSRKNIYMAHASAALVGLDKPDVVVSEKPFGIGYSAQSLKELIGALKAELMCSIKWYGVSEARTAVVGNTWGNATKEQTAEWLLQYPWNISSKRFITEQISQSNPELKTGFDILDAIMHGVCYLVKEGRIAPVHKEAKKKAKKRDPKITVEK